MGKIGEKLKERFGPPTFFPLTVFLPVFRGAVLALFGTFHVSLGTIFSLCR